MTKRDDRESTARPTARPATQRPALRGSTQRAHGAARRGTPKGGRTTISVSISAALAERTAEVAGHTQWAQSHIVANALELYTELPTAALYRLNELRGRLGAERFRAAVAEAIEREADHLEWQAVAEATTRELADRLPATLSEEAVVAHARSAIAESRTARRSRTSGGTARPEASSRR